MDTTEQSNTLQAIGAVFCFLIVPTFTFLGLLANGALAPGAILTGEFAAWMAVFVVSVFFPVHLVAQVIVFLFLKNRFSFRWPLKSILVSSIVAAAAIALQKAGNPFSLVFSVATVPFFLFAYVVASGQSRGLQT